jgi:hypothetical protein
MSDPKVTFCWLCGRSLGRDAKGKTAFVERVEDGHKRVFHKQCAADIDNRDTVYDNIEKDWMEKEKFRRIEEGRGDAEAYAELYDDLYGNRGPKQGAR